MILHIYRFWQEFHASLQEKTPQGSPGRPWKGKQGSRRCPQELPGNPREPLSLPERFPRGPQRVPARAPSSPGIFERAPKFSNSPMEGPKGSLRTQICSVLHPNVHKNDMIFRGRKAPTETSNKHVFWQATRSNKRSKSYFARKATKRANP